MCFKVLVFPVPKKPLSRVTGVTGETLPSRFAGSFFEPTPPRNAIKAVDFLVRNEVLIKSALLANEVRSEDTVSRTEYGEAKSEKEISMHRQTSMAELCSRIPQIVTFCTYLLW
jgi:hypothetical protein